MSTQLLVAYAERSTESVSSESDSGDYGVKVVPSAPVGPCGPVAPIAPLMLLLVSRPEFGFPLGVRRKEFAEHRESR